MTHTSAFEERAAGIKVRAGAPMKAPADVPASSTDVSLQRPVPSGRGVCICGISFDWFNDCSI